MMNATTISSIPACAEERKPRLGDLLLPDKRPTCPDRIRPHRPEGRAVPRNYSDGRTVVSLAADRGARVNALRSCYPLSDFLLGAGLIYTDEKLRPMIVVSQSLSYRTRCEEASGRLARVVSQVREPNIQQAFILDTALNGGP